MRKIHHREEDRPRTRYGQEPVACPQCGHIEPPDTPHTICLGCGNAGHLYRLMGQAELTWSAEQCKRDGFAEVARRKAKIAANLKGDAK